MRSKAPIMPAPGGSGNAQEAAPSDHDGAHPDGAGSSFEGERIKILIVDDEPKNLTVLETILDDPSYELVRASSADQALLALIADEFAVLILDIRMPGMTGFELAQMIKERKKTAGVPIIFLTAYYNEDQHELEGYGRGAVDYLHKPVNPIFLRSKVAVFAELHRRNRESGLANRALLAEVTGRRHAQEQLQALNETLEQRVHERTEALSKSEVRFRRTFENAPIGIAHLSLDGRWLRVNGALCEITGYSPEELSAMTLVGISHPHEVDVNVMEMRRLLTGEISNYTAEKRYVCKDGSHIWVNLSVSLLRDLLGEPVHFIAAIEDISAKKATLEELNKQRRFVERLTDVMPSVLYVYDLAEKRDIWFNRTIAQVAGYGPDEIQAMSSVRQIMHPEDALRFDDHLSRVAALSEVETAIFEYRITDKAGRWHWFHSRDAIFSRDADRGVQQIIGTAIEITDRKRAEEDLQRANEDLEQFAFSASHDLQEPLRNIAIFSQLLKRQYGGRLDAQADQFFGYLIEGAQRMSQLVSDLLAFTQSSNLQPEQLTDVDSGMVFEQVVKDLEPSAQECLGVITCGPLPLVAMKEIHLQQLLQNLTANALKYRKDDESPRVHVSARRQVGEWIFSIQDNGIGIAADDQAQVFGIFKRLHAKGGKYSGTGMGLAICERIVQRYGGRIWIESQPGAGSTFHFTIPAAT